MANIPSSIEELYCDNNELSKIDISNTNIIKFKCSNNNILEISNIPDTIKYFDCSCNPLYKKPSIQNTNCKIRWHGCNF